MAVRITDGADSRHGVAFDYPELRLLIDNEWRTAAVSTPVLDPATEQVLGAVPHASAADIEDALAGSERGFETWRRMPPGDRGAVIHEAARLLRERGAYVATMITREMGKP